MTRSVANPPLYPLTNRINLPPKPSNIGHFDPISRKSSQFLNFWKSVDFARFRLILAIFKVFVKSLVLRAFLTLFRRFFRFPLIILVRKRYQPQGVNSGAIGDFLDSSSALFLDFLPISRLLQILDLHLSGSRFLGSSRSS